MNTFVESLNYVTLANVMISIVMNKKIMCINKVQIAFRNILITIMCVYCIYIIYELYIIFRKLLCDEWAPIFKLQSINHLYGYFFN